MVKRPLPPAIGGSGVDRAGSIQARPPPSAGCRDVVRSCRRLSIRSARGRGDSCGGGGDSAVHPRPSSAIVAAVVRRREIGRLWGVNGRLAARSGNLFTVPPVCTLQSRRNVGVTGTDFGERTRSPAVAWMPAARGSGAAPRSGRAYPIRSGREARSRSRAAFSWMCGDAGAPAASTKPPADLVRRSQ